MSHKSILLLSSVLLLAAAPARADAQLPATISSPSPGTWRMDWEARPGMTYFVQWSEDLENWNWFPAAVRAAGPQSFQSSPVDAAGAPLPRFFIRLLGIDPANPPSWWSDSDGDGLPDAMENDIGTNPSLPDTDGDGMSDGDELDLGLDPNDSCDVEPLVENDPGAPVPPAAPGIVFLSVTGDNDPGTLPPVQGSKTENLAKDTAYLAVVAVESGEFPEFTRTSSEWNDTFEWSLKINDIPESSGSSHVNALHSQWLEAVRRGSSLFGLRPLHYLHLGVVKPRHALRTADLFAKVGNVSDDALPTTLVLALVPVKTAPASGTAQTLGDMVPSNKLPEPGGFRFHFVTPKDSAFLPGGFAEFNVESPPRDIFGQLLRWAPGSAGEPLPSDPDNPLRRRLSRAAPGKFPLKLETNPEKTGLPAAEATELDAWVVWAEGEIRNKAAYAYALDHDARKTIGSQDTEAVVWRLADETPASHWQFEFKIEPPEIITDLKNGGDAPNLANAKNKEPKVPGDGTDHQVLGTDLKFGAINKWDVSRQVQIDIRNPNLIPKNDLLAGFFDLYDGQPKADSTPVPFPGDPVLGNDDSGTGDEDNNPYAASSDATLHHEAGSITSSDGPDVLMSGVSAAPGRIYQETDSFREFARLQLPSGWFRISDNLQWSATLKIKCDQNSDQWADDGSSTDPQP